jgi:hypothetical protein
MGMNISGFYLSHRFLCESAFILYRVKCNVTHLKGLIRVKKEDTTTDVVRKEDTTTDVLKIVSSQQDTFSYLFSMEVLRKPLFNMYLGHNPLHHDSFGPRELGIAKDPTHNKHLLLRGKHKT